MDDRKSIVNLILLCIINGFFAIIRIILHCIVMLSFLMSSALLCKTFYFPVHIMSCVDLLNVIVGHPLLVASTVVCWISGDSSGSVFHFVVDCLVFLFGGFSTMTIIVMSLERYLAVLHPFYYRRTMTKRRLFTLTLVFCSVYAFCWALSFKYPSYVFLIVPVIMFTLLAYLNYKVFKTARQKRESSKLQLNAGNVGGELRYQAITAKTASICLLVVVCCLVAVTPVIVFGVLDVFAAKAVATSPVPLSLWVKTVLVINSTANCLVLIWKKNTLQKEIRRIVATTFRQRKDTHNHSVAFKHQHRDIQHPIKNGPTLRLPALT